MNTIKINHKWRANWDGRQFILEQFLPGGAEVFSPHDGKTVISKPGWRGEGRYFSSMLGAVSYVINTEAANNAKNLKEFIAIQRQLVGELEKLLDMPTPARKK